MKYPQTTAKEIGKHCENIGKYGCLAMCYLYCMGFGGEDTDFIRLVASAIENGLLDEECTVLDAEKYINWFSGRKVTVVKKKVSNIKDIKDLTPVAYDYNGKRHWVVVQNGKIVFNSIMNSLCVNKGKPAEARIIKLA